MQESFTPAAEPPAAGIADAAPDLDLSGRQFGDYCLLRRLGRGGMADVYLAEQQSLRRQVALKVLKSDLADNQSYVQRFHLEAQAAAALVHANIVQIHEVGRVNGVHFIAQEYVPGMNLREWMTRRGAIDVTLALLIMRQVAAALHKAAEQGIVHRDIKPENIMISQTGDVKVADFGLARVAGEGGMNITRVGVTMGTPLYMSPEQVEGKSLDHRSDIYSFGVTCYHMLAGEPPFRGETALGIAVQHLRSQPERLESLRPDLPPALCRIVHQMLAKDPTERYATARLLLKDLRSLQEDESGEAWPEELAQWTAAELAALHSRCDATQQLAGLMKTEAMVLRRPKWTRYTAVALLGAFSIGCGAAYLMREPNWLQLPASRPVVERKANAEAQYVYALLVDTEDAWRAVLDHWGDDKNLRARAEQGLARLYLRRGDYDPALALFEKFAKMDDVERQYKAFGYAGQAIVYALKLDYDKAADALSDVWPLRNELTSAKDMGEMIQEVYHQIRKAKSRDSQDEREQWFRKNFPTELSSATTP